MEKLESAPTFKEIRAILKETAIIRQKNEQETQKMRQEFDRKMQESKQEFDRKMQESKKETDRRIQETDRRIEENDRFIKSLAKEDKKLKNLFTNNWGKLVESLVESLVEGDLLKQLASKGIHIKSTSRRMEGTITATNTSEEDKHCEIDILAHNGKEIVAVEVKSDCNQKDIDHFLDVLHDFTNYFQIYRGKIVYGAIAYLKIQKGADRYAEKKGLFVIQATGNSSRITNQKNFKPKDFS